MDSCSALRTFYIDSINGSDDNSGTSPDLPWKTIQKINTLQASVQIQAGDSFLLKAGCSFTDTIVLQNVKGTKLHPIKIGKYNEREAVNLRPTLICSEKSNHSIRLIDCEHICIENLDIKKGGIYATFGKLSYDLNTTNLPTEEVTGLRFLNVRVTDVQTVSKQAGAIEIELLGDNFFLTDVEIDNCEINNVTCHAILLGTEQQTVNLNVDNQHSSYKNVLIHNTKTKNTASSAVVLNNVLQGRLQFNELEASGQFFDNINSAGASGIELLFCQNVIVDNNRIRFSSGPKHSTAIVVGPSSKNLQITSNFSSNNVGGLINCKGNCSDIDISLNISINDGLRKKDQTTNTRNGNSVVISDYVGWCNISNTNVKILTTRINIHNNLFATTPSLLTSNTIAIYGKATDINISNNMFANDSSAMNAIVVDDTPKININIQNNLSNSKWKTLKCTNNNCIDLNLLNDTSLKIDDNKELFNQTCVDLFFKKNEFNDHFTNESIKNAFIKFDKRKGVIDKPIQKDKLYVFFCCTHALCYLNSIPPSFNTAGVTYLNRELIQQYKISQNIQEIIYDPSLLLNSEKAKAVLNDEKSISAPLPQTSQELLWLLFKKTKHDKNDDCVLYFGSESISHPMNFLFQHILEHAEKYFDVHFIVLLNNSFDEIVHRFYRIIERGDMHQHSVNNLTNHYANTTFKHIIEGIGFLKSNISESNFSIIELSWLNTLGCAQKFWELQTLISKSPLIRNVFDKLSKSTAFSRPTVSDIKINCSFFNFLTSNDYIKLTETEKRAEITKILKIQQKYSFNDNDHVLLKFNEDSILHHESFLKGLENVGCNLCCKTAFLDNGYDHTTKRIRMDYFELPILEDNLI